jgi:hypothetical protein
MLHRVGKSRASGEQGKWPKFPVGRSSRSSRAELLLIFMDSAEIVTW